jgi:hypothetical protein
MDQQAVIERTRRWISSVVIGLNLCPFAPRVFQGDKIRYAVTGAHDAATLLKELTGEIETLVSSPIARTETTLLIHPYALGDFLAYNEFLGAAEQLVADFGWCGVVQLASFHPDYQFAGTDPDAVENYTNRSPYPMLHILREESISAVAGDPGALREIPRRNVATLRGLGLEKIREKLKALEDSVPPRPSAAPGR